MADPIANNDIYSATAGETAKLGTVLNVFGFTIDLNGLLKNDSDADGDTLQVVSAEGQSLSNGSVVVSGSEGGLFTILADGSFDFDSTTGFEDLAEGETRETVLTYEVSDGQTTSFATVTVIVTGIAGDSVFAADDSFSTDELTVITGENVNLNDQLFDSSATITEVNGVQSNVGQAVEGSQGGFFTIESDGTFSFDPSGDFTSLALGFSKDTSITYTYQSESGDISTATASVTVNGLNEAPVSAGDSNQEPHIFTGETYQILAGLSENMGYNQLIDPYGIDVEIGFGLLTNDQDPDGDPLSIVAVDGQNLVNGSIVLGGDNGGVFTIAEDGTVDFDASTGFELLRSGEYEDTSVTYTVSDGVASGDASVTVRVFGRRGDAIDTVNDFYSPGLAQEFSYREGAGSLFLNDWSYDGSFNVVSVGDMPSNVGQTLDVGYAGIWTLNTDGSFDFDTNGEFAYLKEGESTYASINYRVANDLGERDNYYYYNQDERLYVEVTGVNDAATANDDFYTANAGEAVTLAEIDNITVNGLAVDIDQTVLNNDVDIDNDILSISEVNGLALSNGEITVAGDNGGLFTVLANGTVTFDDTSGGTAALAEGESGVTQISYTVSDGNGSTDQAVISVAVNGVNDAPVTSNDDLGVVYRGGDLSFSLTELMANDTDIDNGSTIIFNEFVDVLKGSLSSFPDGTVVWRQNDEFSYLQDGDLEQVSFGYTVVDEFGAVSNQAIASFTVDGANIGPVATADVYSVLAGESETIAFTQDVAGRVVDLSVLRNDTDGNNDQLTIESVNGSSLVAGQITVTGDNGGLFTVSEDGTVVFDGSTGEFDFVPKETIVSTTINYTVIDGFGGSDSSTITVEVTGTYDAPVGTENDSFDLSENASSILLDVLANDEDPDAYDDIEISFVNTVGLQGQLDVVDGSLYYTSDPAFDALANGEVVATSFTYNVDSSDGTSETATVALNILGENDAPVAETDSLDSIAANQTALIDVADLLANDTDVDNGAIISFVGFDAPTEGAVIDNGDGTYTFDPQGAYANLAEDEVANISLTYSIQDENGASSSGTVGLAVIGVNESPVIDSSGSSSISEEELFEFDSAFFDAIVSDVDNGSSFTVTDFSSLAPAETLADNGDSTWTFDPTVYFDDLAAGESETLVFDFSIEDEFGGSDDGFYSITVNGVDDPIV